MKGVVLDASVALAWCFDDEDEAPLLLLDAADRLRFHVPSIWLYEVANGLAVAERRRRIKPAESSHFLALLEALDLAIEPVTAGSSRGLLDLARTHSLSAYDAAYLDVAQRLGMPLATVDETLARAAGDAGVANGLHG